MGSPREQDLAALTLDACLARVGQEFVRPNPDGPDVTLRLAHVEKMKRDSRAPGPEDRPFVLVFHGPADPRLTQGMHDLEHPVFTLRGIFLVPSGQDDEGFLYEAVFS